MTDKKSEWNIVESPAAAGRVALFVRDPFDSRRAIVLSQDGRVFVTDNIDAEPVEWLEKNA